MTERATSWVYSAVIEALRGQPYGECHIIQLVLELETIYREVAAAKLSVQEFSRLVTAALQAEPEWPGTLWERASGTESAGDLLSRYGERLTTAVRQSAI